MKNLKARLRRGETLIGCWLNLGSSVSAEIVAGAGFDWVLIDLEHGIATEKDVLHLLQAIEHTPAAAMVRVESSQRQRAHRILDFGAEGVMFPRIATPAEAQQAAQALRYQPEGVRGVARMVRAANFGANFNEYITSSRESVVGIVQVENEEILDSLDAVAAIEGIDVLFVGPSDLSMAMGIFGQFEHPRFIDAVARTAAAAQKAGKAAGVLLSNSDEFGMYYELGYRFIACSSDIGFVNNGARQMASALNHARASQQTAKY